MTKIFLKVKISDIWNRSRQVPEVMLEAELTRHTQRGFAPSEANPLRQHEVLLSTSFCLSLARLLLSSKNSYVQGNYSFLNSKKKLTDTLKDITMSGFSMI